VTNILVLKLRYLGDVLLATPVLRALRERVPHAKVTMAVSAGTEAVLKWNPHINDVIVVGRTGIGTQLDLLRRLRRQKFDCVIDLTDGDRSAILAWATGAAVRVGVNEEHRWRGLLYTNVARRSPDSRHRIDQDLDVLRALGVDPILTPPVLKTSGSDDEEATRLLRTLDSGLDASPVNRPLVMLQPGARYWFKAWPAERFAELADRLTVRFDCRVLIGGDHHERELAETIQKQARSRPIVVAGRTTILQHAALIKRCALFVGNDNGPMHMAAALGTPVVALFGPSDPAEWGPRGAPSEVVYKGLDCRRCFHPTCFRGEQSCMKLIMVEEVFAAAERLLGARCEVRGTTPQSGLEQELPTQTDRASHVVRRIIRPAAPLVSVVIPVFNGAPFVAAAVESVRAQTVKDVEILIVDDGSVDGTQSVLEDLSRTSGIRWFQQAHGGPARSRNRGIEAAQGEFVALLDCDDIWLPEKLELQLAVLTVRTEIGVVHTDYESVDPEGRVLERIHASQSPEPLVRAFQGGHTALPSTLLIRRSVLNKVGALNPDLYGSEDSDLTIRLYRATAFECIQRVLVKKLQRGHGYRDMAFEENTHREKILVSRERFLAALETMQPLTGEQRAALDREWVNYFLSRGRAADLSGRRIEARHFYRQAIRLAPTRLRPYTRLIRTWLSPA